MTDKRTDLKIADGVAVIVLSNPESRNSLDPDLAAELADLFHEARENPEVRVIVFTGVDRSFCSGADMKMESDDLFYVDEEELRRRFDEGYHRLVLAIRSTEIPIIAAINGPAAGIGFDLALGMDIRYVSDKAFFTQVFIRRAVGPDGGGSWLLPRIVGIGKATELMMTGDRVSAEEALNILIANKVIPHEKLLEETLALAKRLAKMAPVAMKRIKSALRKSQEMTFREALDMELNYAIPNLQSEDFAESVRAFVEKREPVFRGK